MQITWYGQSCFKIQTKTKRGGENVVLTTNIFDKNVGLRPPQGQMDIITLSNISYLTPKIKTLEKKSFIIDSSGEYSLEGINIEGVERHYRLPSKSMLEKKVLLIIESENIRVCHLGNIGDSLTEKQVEAIGEIDILLIPVGNSEKINIKTIKNIIGQLELGILIPMNYKVKGLKENLDDCENFCEEFGGNKKNKENKLTIKAKDVKDMENNLVVLSVN